MACSSACWRSLRIVEFVPLLVICARDRSYSGQGRAARDTAGRVYALLTGLMRRYDFETFRPKTGHPIENGIDIVPTNENELRHELDVGHDVEHEHKLG